MPRQNVAAKMGTSVKSRWHVSNESIKENRTLQAIRSCFPPLNFITIHYAYFITMCLVTSLIFWGSSNPSKSIGYTDSLFLVISAMTEAGLNTVNLSQMTTFQQVILWFLIVTGSSIWVSIFTVLTRKRVFEQRFRSVVRMQKGRKRRNSSRSMERGLSAQQRVDDQRKAAEPVDHSEFESRHSGPRDPTPQPSGCKLVSSEGYQNILSREGNGESGVVIGAQPNSAASRDRRMSSDADCISIVQYAPSSIHEPGHRRIISFEGVVEKTNQSADKLPHSSGLLNRGEKKLQELEKKFEDGVDNLENLHYPAYLTRHTTGRNANFYGLSREEREHLGGVEYRAITLLAWIVPVYFVLWQFLGCIGLAAYMTHNKRDVVEANGINPWWLGIFNGASAFNNSGMSLLDANLIPFQTSVYTLMTMGLLILAGNTCYPIFLRLILWSLLRLLCMVNPSPKSHSSTKSTLRFILKYPRRVYTNLFPSAPTWWLLFMVIALNGIDWAGFELLNIGNKATEAIPHDYRILDGLFQALAVRSGGFYIISIPTLRIGLQFLYVIMMYISVYPVVITMRHSNVYEERSLGIYADVSSSSESSPERGPVSTTDLPQLGSLTQKFRRTMTHMGAPLWLMGQKQTRTGASKQFIRQQIRGQLAHDLWWLVLAVLFITCIEVSNFDRDPVTYSVFNIVFEVVSGYGCVGISTGLPNEAYSFSGGWHKASKLILCAVMLRGRHRGLPVALDRAVRLPGEGLERHEEEDRVLRRSRSLSRSGVAKM